MDADQEAALDELLGGMEKNFVDSIGEAFVSELNNKAGS